MIGRFVQDDALPDGFYFLFRLLRLFFELGLHLGGRGGLGLGLEFLFQLLEKPCAFVLVDMRDDVACEIHDFLDLSGGESEHECDARGDAAQEPDVGYRRREVDVAHPFAAHDGARYLDTAFLTDDAAEADAAVFAAVTFVVLLGPEHALIEEAVLLGALGTVVDGLRLRYLAVRPLRYALGRS